MLTARRLVERGVRFIELTCPKVDADRWDQHGQLKEGHERNSLAIDQRSLFCWKTSSAEDSSKRRLSFGRASSEERLWPRGSNGRDHNPFGFTIWMAGGGVKGGTIYGATDEYGYFAIEKKSTIHDLHATMLHLLGVDHKRLTYDSPVETCPD